MFTFDVTVNPDKRR